MSFHRVILAVLFTTSVAHAQIMGAGGKRPPPAAVAPRPQAPDKAPAPPPAAAPHAPARHHPPTRHAPGKEG